MPQKDSQPRAELFARDPSTGQPLPAPEPTKEDPKVASPYNLSDSLLTKVLNNYY